MRITGGALVALAVVVAACTTGSNSGSTTPGPIKSSDSGTNTSAVAPGETDGYQVCWTNPIVPSNGAIVFTDETSAFGLESPLTGMRGHAAAWGDVNDDGVSDLVVGTFALARNDVYAVRGATGPSPDRLLVGGDSTFELSSFPEQYGRTSGAALADLDGDGDPDLVLSRNVNGRDEGASTAVFENDGGNFTEVDSNIDPDLGGRSIGLLDIDQDGLLDLVILEDRYQGRSSKVYRNAGGLAFEDVGAEFGFPEDVNGLGLATSDLNGDGYTDFFVAGSNRLFLGGDSTLTEVPGAIPVWEPFGPEDDVSGAAIADVNRDGWLDLVVGHHFNSTLSQGNQVPVRLYLNTTEATGDVPAFQDVTEEAGLIGLPTKAPHVELADMDNDGWLDIVTTASAEDGSRAAIFRNDGLVDGIPRFTAPDGLGSSQYWVTAPTNDVDQDGRLDLLAVEWEPSLPSILFMNQTPGGHWLEVSVADRFGGVGSRVDIYEGGTGQTSRMGSREIVATLGYTAGVDRVAHFGLGDLDTVDVLITPPFGGEPMLIEGISADARISIGGACHG